MFAQNTLNNLLLTSRKPPTSWPPLTPKSESNRAIKPTAASLSSATSLFYTVLPWRSSRLTPSCVPSRPFSGTCLDTGLAQTEELRMSGKRAGHGSPTRSVPGRLSCVAGFWAGGVPPRSPAADWWRDVNVTALISSLLCCCIQVVSLQLLPSEQTSCALRILGLFSAGIPALSSPCARVWLEEEFSQYSCYLLWHQCNRRVLKLHP